MINFCILLILCVISLVLTYILKYIRYNTYLNHNASVTTSQEISYKDFLKLMKNK